MLFCRACDSLCMRYRNVRPLQERPLPFRQLAVARQRRCAVGVLGGDVLQIHDDAECVAERFECAADAVDQLHRAVLLAVDHHDEVRTVEPERGAHAGESAHGGACGFVVDRSRDVGDACGARDVVCDVVDLLVRHLRVADRERGARGDDVAGDGEWIDRLTRGLRVQRIEWRIRRMRQRRGGTRERAQHAGGDDQASGEHHAGDEIGATARAHDWFALHGIEHHRRAIGEACVADACCMLHRRLVEHRAYRGAVDESHVAMSAGGLRCGEGEFTGGHEDRAGGAFGGRDADQFVHVVVRNLAGFPLLALHDDVLVAAVKFQIHAAVVALSGCIRTDMLDAITLAQIVLADQFFETRGLDARERIVPLDVVALQAHRLSPRARGSGAKRRVSASHGLQPFTRTAPRLAGRLFSTPRSPRRRRFVLKVPIPPFSAL